MKCMEKEAGKMIHVKTCDEIQAEYYKKLRSKLESATGYRFPEIFYPSSMDVLYLERFAEKNKLVKTKALFAPYKKAYEKALKKMIAERISIMEQLQERMQGGMK